jgi:hypothetical protein
MAISQTKPSAKIIFKLVTNLKGKSIKKPASAIGVHNTKKDQLKAETRKPSWTPYFMEIKAKYIRKIKSTKENLIKI